MQAILTRSLWSHLVHVVLLPRTCNIQQFLHAQPYATKYTCIARGRDLARAAGNGSRRIGRTVHVWSRRRRTNTLQEDRLRSQEGAPSGLSMLSVSLSLGMGRNDEWVRARSRRMW
eukprot:5135720-Pyramimonas_sp.AAC.2